MMLSNHDVICILVNIALFRQLILTSWCIFYSILDIKFHIDVSSHEEMQNVFSHLIARFTIRFYVIFEVNKSSNLDSFVSAVFTSMHDLESITLKELARKLQTIRHWESFKTHRFEEASELIVKEALDIRIYIAERTCTKASDSLEYWTEDTNDCCEKMLKVQSSQMCSADVAVRIQLYESINWI